MATHSFGWGSYGLRLLFALLLVFATYNPEGLSYVHWVFADLGDITALKVLVGLLLAVGWTVYLRATLRSLGPIGLALVSALFGCLIWLLIDFDLIKVGSARAISYTVMFVLVNVMAIGISWSHVRRRLSGQVDMDDVEE